ncbi:leukocyte cysteine proteinase inhibitor 1-like [Aythya fuligula]|uniref:Leukocyte cysteine proteinase inhibitor 1-like n=1 Tax=Aythya fuligula TaxID=219594 RepID=A0A6J3DA50_AYTFU|nr:leukocyte cysteine proteinase inhibitor 1-like [Aythya fuligula]
MEPGGLSKTQPATPEIQHIVDQVKAEYERRENRTFDIFQAIVYRDQLVAGTNYFIKVQISDTSYAHLRVFQALPQEKQGPNLESYQIDKTRDDPVTPF